ncbi:hypothetical protein CWI36_0486p0010 [Hamiltosporidium magnivora]|uniref:Uncharacterized protein n=1 Tax=Hamiltosporidium magnivora TaxID=148818 RepID=A0A4Q9LGE2_9MICR|nr:hypothetical protein CWI36_0486p0010 [Hamiltosporidium magnivora]
MKPNTIEKRYLISKIQESNNSNEAFEESLNEITLIEVGITSKDPLLRVEPAKLEDYNFFATEVDFSKFMGHEIISYVYLKTVLRKNILRGILKNKKYHNYKGIHSLDMRNDEDRVITEEKMTKNIYKEGRFGSRNVLLNERIMDSELHKELDDSLIEYENSENLSLVGLENMGDIEQVSSSNHIESQNTGSNNFEKAGIKARRSIRLRESKVNRPSGPKKK